MPVHHIVVFCASGPFGPTASHYLKLAHRFGQLLAENRFHCVNGGASGMMRELSVGAHEAGGVVHCVNLAQYPPDHAGYTHLESHDLLYLRQHHLIKKGEAFVALPGGVGTRYEIYNILSMMTLDELPTDRPLICVGEREYATLRAELDNMLACGLMKPYVRDLVTFVPTIEEAIEVLKHRLR